MIGVNILKTTLALFCLLAVPAAAQTIYVQDGDTIYVDRQPIRLEGIDAPEKAQTCVGPEAATFKCGLSATRVLSKILTQGELVCTPSGRDRYGRVLAHCMAGSTDVNGEMVARGYARAFTKYSGEYMADEAEAMAAKRGLWAGTWQAPWDWRAEHR